MNDFSLPKDRGDHLDFLLATSEIGIWELDVKTGKALRNLRHDQIFGHAQLLDMWSGEIFLTYVHEEHRERIGDLLSNAVTDGKPWAFETRIRRADGVDRWISAKGLPKFSETGDVIKLIGYVIDITETKQNEDRLRLLSSELDHRVSNTITIMNSIIRHGAKDAQSVPHFANDLMDRLASLARSNKVLTAHEAERSSLQDILQVEMGAFLGWQERIQIDGSTPVWFSSQASEALSLIFHELLTNAVKHGALSNATGKITITITSGSKQKTIIEWVESGGPPVKAERRSGIGSTILNSAMQDEGEVVVEFAPAGLKCHIVVNDSYQREVSDRPVVHPVANSGGMSDAESRSTISDRRILVVEDDPIIGLDISEILMAAGASVLGPYRTVEAALKATGEAPDAALLDVNLGLSTSEDVAVRLSELDIPFIVLSGETPGGGLGSPFAKAPMISKPFAEYELLNGLTDLFRNR